MAPPRLTIILLLSGLFACGQNPPKHKADPAAVEFNKKALGLMAFVDNLDSSRKAVSLLDSATLIDSNFFAGYYNKLMFLNSLRQFDKAILAANNAIRIRPFAHDLYLTRGIFYDQLGDTISSTNDFQRSLAICNTVLDTMDSKNTAFDYLLMNKATNLIMLGDQKEGNRFLKQLYDKETDEGFKKFYGSLMNKPKKEFLALLNSSDQEDSVYPINK
jgi:tetratricopeptide (TPR) repeat protein